MAFFDKLTETINNTSKKAKDYSDISALNAQISAQQGILNGCFAEIGRAYYEANHENADDPFAESMQKIGAAKETILSLQRQILAIKGLKVCENCGNQIPVEAAFCPSCGARAAVEQPAEPEPETPAPDVPKTCPGCGAELPPDAMFCTNCGHKIEPQQAPEPPVRTGWITADMPEQKS